MKQASGQVACQNKLLVPVQANRRQRTMQVRFVRSERSFSTRSLVVAIQSQGAQSNAVEVEGMASSHRGAAGQGPD